MQSAPDVSVVLPVWNGERFLAEAVESVLSQTLDTFELLLVDDGSTDATAHIAGDFARRDSRVKVIRLGRSGFALALNSGIAEARGRYVARMDADDISYPARLQKQIAYLDAHADCVAVGTGVDVIDEAGEYVGTRTFPEHHRDITYTLINGSNALAHPTVMTRRDALLAVGGYRPDRAPSEDLDLWIRMSHIGELANLREQLLRYRRHRDAFSIREREGMWRVGSHIVNEARARQGLQPLQGRVLWAAKSRLADYHFECARTALLSGTRSAAFKHARASIATEPSRAEAYAALVACALPRCTLRLLARVSDRFRTRVARLG